VESLETRHGKNACNGVSGANKIKAAKARLQRPTSRHLVTSCKN